MPMLRVFLLLMLNYKVNFRKVEIKGSEKEITIYPRLKRNFFVRRQARLKKNTILSILCYLQKNLGPALRYTRENSKVKNLQN